jgi:hypothetical protein
MYLFTLFVVQRKRKIGGGFGAGARGFFEVTSRTWRGRWTFLLPSRRSLMVRSWRRGSGGHAGKKNNSNNKSN